MAINLITTYKRQLVDGFSHDSFTLSHASNEYTFDGSHSIILTSMLAVDPVESWPNAPRSGGDRFGTVTDVEDITQTLTLGHHTKWTKSIDGSDNAQQAYMKRAGEYMSLMIREKLNPLRDKYNLKKWALNAGTIVTAAASVSKSNIVDYILDIEVAFDNAGVPQSDRWVFAGNSKWKMIREASEWVGADNLTRDMIVKGYKGSIGSLNFVFVPDSYMPTAVELLAIHKGSVIAPLVWKTARILETAQGYDGPVMEYHDLYDAFVIGKKNLGVYALLANGNSAQVGAITVTKGSTTTSISAASGSPTIYYTLDGTDPAYSSTRTAYSAAFTNPAAGTILRVYAEKSDGSLYPATKTHTCV